MKFPLVDYFVIAGFGLVIGIGLVTPIAVAQEAPAEATVVAGASSDPFGNQGKGGGGPPGGQPAGTESTPGDKKPGEAKPDEAKPGDVKPEGAEPKVIRRDQAVAEPANAEELRKAVLGDDGKVAFEFRNQTWPELIQWLSALSAEPIDWQELPGDRVNITTPSRYNVDEVRDLLNRHLLGRGYTLLALDGGLTVVKCDSINPSLVPRVDEAELTRLKPHSFARMSMDVGWLSATKLAEELKPMMSKNGLLTALTTTNRIEAMDAAITLRHVAELLAQERNAASREALAPEFKLRHLPAEEAKSMLEQFLGIEKKKEAPMSPEQMQMMQQMRQQQGGQPPPTEKTPEISVVANNRQNSLIIQAPPDRVAVAMEFLKRVDVPSSSISSLADVQNRVQVFRLASLDPEKLIEILQEMNILEPTTRTRADAKNRAVIVSGSAADRFIIDQLIKRLDGSGRQFEVLQLRRLDAVEVAESITFLMGQEKEEKENSRNRYSYWGAPQEEKKKEDTFRVAANTRFRQVLLWANDAEMAEVRNLLVKLGEMPPPGGDPRTVRVIDASPTPETLEYLRRLKKQFEATTSSTIELPSVDAFTDPDKDAAVEGDVDAIDNGSGESADSVNDSIPPERTIAVPANGGYRFAVLQNQAGDDEMAGEPSSEINSVDDFDRVYGKGESAPQPRMDSPQAQDTGLPSSVQIDIDAAGNIILRSEDTAALDRLERMMLQFSPPKRPYTVFKIKHASASWMKLNLVDYFKDLDAKDDSQQNNFFRWYFDDDGEEEKKKPGGLGKNNKLRFVDDIDTNTIVVNGADGEQLATIKDLISLWDVPEPVNKRKTRFTRLMSIEFGKAEKVANTVKDAYRDLLSSNDKAFQQQAPGGDPSTDRKNTPKNRDGNGSGLVDTGAGGRDSGGSDFTFKGKLSIGVDDLGNTLIVSAEGEPLLELVCDMIKQLDEASRPSGDVQVIQLSGGLSGDSLKAALRAFGAKTKAVEENNRPREEVKND